MTEPKKSDDNNKSKESRENLFQIMDGIIQQLNSVLSRWTKKYERYRELQRKIDEKLDYDESNDKEPE